MTPEELKTKVDDVIAFGGDDEMAHSAGDDLHLEVINAFCPQWVKDEIERLQKADFQRWCA